jgi:hypothetical protein
MPAARELGNHKTTLLRSINKRGINVQEGVAYQLARFGAIEMVKAR